MTARLYDYSEPSSSFDSGGMFLVSFVVYEVKVYDWICIWINWETTLPQVLIKGFDLCKKKETPTSLAQRGWLGIILLITPVFRNWNKRMYIISKVYLKA